MNQNRRNTLDILPYKRSSNGGGIARFGKRRNTLLTTSSTNASASLETQPSSSSATTKDDMALLSRLQRRRQSIQHTHSHLHSHSHSHPIVEEEEEVKEVKENGENKENVPSSSSSSPLTSVDEDVDTLVLLNQSDGGTEYSVDTMMLLNDAKLAHPIHRNGNGNGNGTHGKGQGQDQGQAVFDESVLQRSGIRASIHGARRLSGILRSNTKMHVHKRNHNASSNFYGMSHAHADNDLNLNSNPGDDPDHDDDDDDTVDLEEFKKLTQFSDDDDDSVQKYDYDYKYKQDGDVHHSNQKDNRPITIDPHNHDTKEDDETANTEDLRALLDDMRRGDDRNTHAVAATATAVAVPRSALKSKLRYTPNHKHGNRHIFQSEKAKDEKKEEDEEVMNKSVVFGNTPEYAEYNKTSPSASLTPLPSSMRRALSAVPASTDSSHMSTGNYNSSTTRVNHNLMNNNAEHTMPLEEHMTDILQHLPESSASSSKSSPVLCDEDSIASAQLGNASITRDEDEDDSKGDGLRRGKLDFDGMIPSQEEEDVEGTMELEEGLTQVLQSATAAAEQQKHTHPHHQDAETVRMNHDENSIAEKDLKDCHEIIIDVSHTVQLEDQLTEVLHHPDASTKKKNKKKYGDEKDISQTMTVELEDNLTAVFNCYKDGNAEGVSNTMDESLSSSYDMSQTVQLEENITAVIQQPQHHLHSTVHGNETSSSGLEVSQIVQLEDNITAILNHKDPSSSSTSLLSSTSRQSSNDEEDNNATVQLEENLTAVLFNPNVIDHTESSLYSAERSNDNENITASSLSLSCITHESTDCHVDHQQPKEGEEGTIELEVGLTKVLQSVTTAARQGQQHLPHGNHQSDEKADEDSNAAVPLDTSDNNAHEDPPAIVSNVLIRINHKQQDDGLAEGGGEDDTGTLSIGAASAMKKRRTSRRFSVGHNARHTNQNYGRRSLGGLGVPPSIPIALVATAGDNNGMNMKSNNENQQQLQEDETESKEVTIAPSTVYHALQTVLLQSSHQPSSTADDMAFTVGMEYATQNLSSSHAIITEETLEFMQAVVDEVENKSKHLPDDDHVAAQDMVIQDIKWERAIVASVEDENNMNKDNKFVRLVQRMTSVAHAECIQWESQVMQCLQFSSDHDEWEQRTDHMELLLQGIYKAVHQLQDRRSLQAQKNSIRRRRDVLMKLRSDVEVLDGNCSRLEDDMEGQLRHLNKNSALHVELHRLSLEGEVERERREKARVAQRDCSSYLGGVLSYVVPRRLDGNKVDLTLGMLELSCDITSCVTMNARLAEKKKKRKVKKGIVDASSSGDYCSWDVLDRYETLQLQGMCQEVNDTVLEHPSEIIGVVQMLYWRMGRLDMLSTELRSLLRKYESLLEFGEEADCCDLSLTLDLTSKTRPNKVRVCFDLSLSGYPYRPFEVCMESIIGKADMDGLGRQLCKNATPGYMYLSRACDVISSFMQ